MNLASAADNIPLYARVAGVLRQRIETGELGVGVMLPTLEDFMVQFGASRVTMRLAMDMLEAERLIVRRRGFGTVVTARPEKARHVALPATWDELLARLVDVKRTVFAVDLDATPSADELNMEPVEPLNTNASVRREPGFYVRLRARHEHAGAAYCHVDAWIERSIYDTSKRALKTTPALTVLVEKHNDHVATVTQSMTLGMADIDVAESLHVAMGSPIALVRRTVFDRFGERLYASKIHFPARVVRLDTTLYVREK
jgi:GntR family transcriptional regulator